MARRDRIRNPTEEAPTPESVSQPDPIPQAAPQMPPMLGTDENPDAAFRRAWGNDSRIREVLTAEGGIRGGLRPSEVERAKEILRGFGLEAQGTK
jgi:hypothetical protein